MQCSRNYEQMELASVLLQIHEKSLVHVEFECWILLFGRSSSVMRRPGDTMHTLKTFTNLKRRQTNCCSICCFRCHLFLCVYLARCHVELPRTAEPSSSSGSGGRVEGPPCSPVTQHSRERPARPIARRTRARARRSWGIPSEHAQSTGLVLGRSHCSALPPSKPSSLNP